MSTHKIIRQFVLAGNAILTVQSPEGKHWTSRIRKAEANGRYPEAWFVGLLVGPSNEDDYRYLGKLNDFTGQVSLTAKSAFTADSFPVRLINRVLARVWGDDQEAFERSGWKVMHNGHCSRCGRLLTTPESVTTGLGETCAEILGVPYGVTTPEVTASQGMKDWMEAEAQDMRAYGLSLMAGR